MASKNAVGKSSNVCSRTEPPASMVTSLLDKVIKEKTVALLHSPEVVEWLKDSQRTRRESVKAAAANFHPKATESPKDDSGTSSSLRNEYRISHDTEERQLMKEDFAVGNYAEDFVKCTTGLLADNCRDSGTNDHENCTDLSVPSKHYSAFKKFSS